MPPTIWPYLLTIPAALLGALGGWFLHKSRPPAGTAHASADGPEADAADLAQKVRDAQDLLAQTESQLAAINRSIEAARTELRERERQHTLLLNALEERRASFENTQGDLNTILQNLQTRERQTDQMLQTIDQSMEEIDMLNDLQETYQAKINRLTQQVQWQDGEIGMLHQTMRARTAEITEARALLEKQEAELRRIIRQRQQREIDLEHARQLLKQRDEELRQAIRLIPPDDLPPTPRERPSVGQSIEVTPRARISLPRAKDALPPPPFPEPIPDDVPSDDLTEIPGLADLYALQLQRQGIRTFRQLAWCTVEQLEQILDIPGHFSPDLKSWIEAARWLVARAPGSPQSG